MKTLIATLLMLSTNAFAEAPAANASNTKTSGGRFQLIQLSNMRRDQYLLDTQTGKIWGMTCLKSVGGDCAIQAWMQEDVENINVSLSQLQKKVSDFEKNQKREPSND